MDSRLTLPEALTSISDEEDEYLAELTRQMAYHTLMEQDDENDKKRDSVPTVRTRKGCETQGWVDLFAVSSPQSTLWSPSGSTRYRRMESTGTEKLTIWDTKLAYEPRIGEISDAIESAQKKSCCDQNRDHESLTQEAHRLGNPVLQFYFPSEQTNPPKRKPRAKNNQRRTRSGLLHGECYVGLSLPQQQKCHPPHVSGFLDSQTCSTGTGVFLPRKPGNPSEPDRRKPSASWRCGVGPFLQKCQPETR